MRPGHTTRPLSPTTTGSEIARLFGKGRWSEFTEGGGGGLRTRLLHHILQGPTKTDQLIMTNGSENRDEGGQCLSL